MKDASKMFPEYKDVLTVQDVIEIMKINRKKVYELIEQNKIFAVKPGHAWIISKRSVIEYVTGEIIND